MAKSDADLQEEVKSNGNGNCIHWIKFNSLLIFATLMLSVKGKIIILCS